MKIPIYKPLNTLKKVAENIWIVDGETIEIDFILFDIPFSTRMTIVKLKNGTLWCHSPIQPSTDLLKEIRELGEVRHLISPNRFNYAYIEEWKKLFPDAVAWSSPGVEARAQSQNNLIQFDHSLEDTPPSAWADEIDQFIFKGGRVFEGVVFFHKNTRTLILADLIQNLEPHKTKNILFKSFIKLAGISSPDGKPPIGFRFSMLEQKNKARASYKRMLGWHPERVLLAHGRWYNNDGTRELKRAFRWLE